MDCLECLVWASSVSNSSYSGLRAESQKLCALGGIGVNERGEKHVLAIKDGGRESSQSWWAVLLDLKKRDLEVPPTLAVGASALGFWSALREGYPETRDQRCWGHKTANALHSLSKGKGAQAKAKQVLQEIWMAEDRAAAHQAFDHFVQTYQAKYPQAVACLDKGSGGSAGFLHFPAEH